MSTHEECHLYAILATRSGGSIFGAAAALCKGREGQVQYYETMAAAEAEAQRLNESLTSKNVHYRVVEAPE